MTISTTASITTIAGNNSTTVFNFDFIAGSVNNLTVTYTSPPPNSVETTVPSSQYSVFLNPAAANALWGVGGTITYPLAGAPIPVGSLLTIQRILPLTQEASIANQGDFYPLVVERALDTLCMEIQQISGRTGQLRGTWSTNVAYTYGDVVIDGVNGNNSGAYYLCTAGNTSTVWTTNLAAGDWAIALPASLPTTPLPLSIANGGTGATTAGTALSNLGGISLTGNNTFTGTNTFTGSTSFTAGTVTVPTAGAGESSTKAASTGFVNGTALTLAAGTTAVTQSANDNSTKVATTAYVDNTSSTNLGAWTTGSAGVVTHALTDGFVVVNIVLGGVSGDVKINGITDSSSSPTTIRCAWGNNLGANNWYGSFTMPVRKGDYWEVTQTIAPTGLTIFWIPLGT